MPEYGLLDDRATARQLLAAGVLDLMVIYVLTRALLPYVPHDLPVVPARFHGIALFTVLIPLFWLLTDLLLAGRSVGRVALGLKMATPEGKTPPFHWRLARLTGRLLTLGIGGVRLDRPASYDRLARITWLSPLSPQSAKPVGEWALRFLKGPIAGSTMRLDRISGFSETTPIRVGRDPAWSMLTLRAPRISGRHCEIDVSNRHPRIRDLGSQNGTFVNGRRIEPGKWVSLDAAQNFAIADQLIALSR